MNRVPEVLYNIVAKEEYRFGAIHGGYLVYAIYKIIESSVLNKSIRAETTKEKEYNTLSTRATISSSLLIASHALVGIITFYYILYKWSMNSKYMPIFKIFHFVTSIIVNALIYVFIGIVTDDKFTRDLSQNEEITKQIALNKGLQWSNIVFIVFSFIAIVYTVRSNTGFPLQKSFNTTSLNTRI